MRTGLTDAQAKAAETSLMAEYSYSDNEDENGQHCKQPIVLEEFKPAEWHTPIPTAKQSNSRYCQTTKVQQHANKCTCKSHQTNKPPHQYQWQLNNTGTTSKPQIGNSTLQMTTHTATQDGSNKNKQTRTVNITLPQVNKLFKA